jgi:hypothetical protein
MNQLRFSYSFLFVCFIFMSSVFTLHAQNQSTCPNSNFSQGNFSDWVGYFGAFDIPAAAQGIIEGRHTIIKVPGGRDPYTNNELATIPPGEQYSAR